MRFFTPLIWLVMLVAAISFGSTDIEFNAGNIPLVGCWVNFILWVVYIIIMVVITWLTTDTGGSFPGATAKEFDIPELTVSNPVPVLFGTQWIKNMNIVWYGDVNSFPYEKCA